MGLALDIAKLLAASPVDGGGGFGDLGTNIFSYKWGKKKDNQILVIPGIGVESPLKELYRNPSFQILVRGGKNSDHDATYSLAQDIYEFLVNKPENVQIGTCSYKGFDPTSDIAALGEDEDERPIFSLNFDTYI